MVSDLSGAFGSSIGSLGLRGFAGDCSMVSDLSEAFGSSVGSLKLRDSIGDCSIVSDLSETFGSSVGSLKLRGLGGGGGDGDRIVSFVCAGDPCGGSELSSGAVRYVESRSGPEGVKLKPSDESDMR